MDGVVDLSVTDGVAVLNLDSPPVNALSPLVLAAILAGLTRIRLDATVRTVVLSATGNVFSAGADIRELDGVAVGPSLGDVCDALEAMPVPVIAVLHGPALGGGAALALAAHWRLGGQAAVLGLPEVSLDLVASAGATQRLPRIVGARVALEMLLSGKPVGAEAARRVGLLDGVVTGDLLSGAMAFSRALADRAAGPRPTRARRERLVDGADHLAAVTAARRTIGLADRARTSIVTCVEAALLLPFPAGCAFEAVQAEDGAARPAARGLRHLVLVERQAPASLIERGSDGTRRLTAEGDLLAERLARVMGRAAGAMARSGAAPERIDAALVDWGLEVGPFGGDVGGAGEEGPAIVRRIIAAVAAEGARLVSEGAVAASGDVDAIAVTGLGLPRASGGPMRSAEVWGLAPLVRDMAAWALEDEVWAVPALMAAAARSSGFERDASPAAA